MPIQQEHLRPFKAMLKLMDESFRRFWDVLQKQEAWSPQLDPQQQALTVTGKGLSRNFYEARNQFFTMLNQAKKVIPKPVQIYVNPDNAFGIDADIIKIDREFRRLQVHVNRINQFLKEGPIDEDDLIKPYSITCR